MVKPAKGTTTRAFIFKEGVMVAADSRASMGGYICMLYFCSFFFDLLNNYRFWMLILYRSSFIVETRLVGDHPSFLSSSPLIFFFSV